MTAKIKKILYATDLSDNSINVFRHALNSAEFHDAQIDVLHVSDSITISFLGLGIEVIPDKKKNALKAIKKRGDIFIQEVLNGNSARMKHVSTIQVVEGDPVAKILEKVDELKPDVLFLGSHSKGKIARIFQGSVANSVLQHSKAPVCVIPIPAG